MPVNNPDQFADFTTAYVNGGAGGVGSNFASGDTTLLLPSGVGNARYPSAFPYYITLGDDASAGGSEIVRVTARSGDTLTVVRNQGGANQTWLNGAPLRLTLSALNLSNLWTTLGYAIGYNVKNYGAIGDGVADDTTAIAAAITAAGAAGGGMVYVPAGTYKITSTLSIGNGSSGVNSTVNGVVVKGEGIYTSIIKWGGAGGGTMAQILGVCYGNMFQDLAFDGNSGSAAIGLYIVSANYTDCPSIRVFNTTTACLKMEAWSAASPNQVCVGVHFGKVVLQCAAGTNVAQSHGLWITGQSNISGVTQCSFDNMTIYAQTNYNTAMRWGFSDFNNFGVINAFYAGGQLGRIGLHVDGLVTNFPQNNYVQLGNFGGAYLTTGTPGNNYIGIYDTNDNAGAAPGVGSGLSGMAEPVGSVIPLYPFGSNAIVNVSGETLNQQLTGTGAVNVVGLTLPTAGYYLCNLTLRITGSTPTITAVCGAQDDSGSNQQFGFNATKAPNGVAYTGLIAAATMAAGTWTCVPVPIRFAGSGSVPYINVQSSVANVVFCTASIIKIG